MTLTLELSPELEHWLQEAATQQGLTAEQYIQQLLQQQRQTSPLPTSAPHSLLELEGLGAELWQGIDPQAYVDELRDEWEDPRGSHTH